MEDQSRSELPEPRMQAHNSGGCFRQIWGQSRRRKRKRPAHLSQFKQFLAQSCEFSERLVDVVLANRLVVRGCLVRVRQQVGSADGFLELDTGLEERVAEGLCV
jgi:hypothetical protein